MRSRYVLKTAITGLGTNRSRSALTILGIVIGITAIILIVSIGQGAEALILNELGGLGAENIVIRPGKEPEGPLDIAGTLFSDSLKDKDLEALRRPGNVPDLKTLMPIIVVPGSVSYESETYRPDIFGGSAEFFAQAFDAYPDEGVVFTENDIATRASVAVIGKKVRRELFGESDAVGAFINVKGRKFRVVGVLPERGQVAFINLNNLVIIPYTTAQAYLLGIDHYHEIIVKTTSPETVPRSVQDIEATLRQSHGITDPDKDDFFVVTQQGLVDQIGVIIDILTSFLSAVVAIALVVGGIGVMNVMLVSVTERTREIGLRKAVGATERDILRQFLTEAILLTGLGGIVGILLGAIFSFLAIFALSYQFEGVAWSFPLWAATLGFLVSVLVGLVFGLYPARKAAKKNPIDALRYE